MSERNGWLGLLAGLIIGSLLGGVIVYVILIERAKTTIKTFAYDDAGRLIQVMKEGGI